MGITYLDNAEQSGKVTYLDNQSQGMDIGRLAGMAGKGVMNSIPGKTVGRLIPGYQNAQDFYNKMGQPQTIGEQITEGLGQMVEDLPVYAKGIAAIRALTGLGPITGGMLGYGGLGGAEGALQGQNPQQAIQTGMTNAAQYPLMHAGAMLGRLAPEGSQVLSRLLTGAGMAGVSAATAPEGQKTSSALLGGGLGAVMPEQKLTPEELQQSGNRIQGNLEKTIRGFYDNLTSGPNVLGKRALAYMASMPQWVFDHTMKRGMNNIDTPLNRDDGSFGGDAGDYKKQLFRDTLDTLDKAKKIVGQPVGELIDPLMNHAISPFIPDIIADAKQSLAQQGLITPEISPEVKNGKLKYFVKTDEGITEVPQIEISGGGGDKIIDAIRKEYKGQFTPEQLDEWFGKPGSESDFTKTQREAAESQLAPDAYFNKVLKKLSTIVTVGQAKSLSDSIATKLENAPQGELDPTQSRLLQVRSKLLDAIGQVGATATGNKNFITDYRIARAKYEEFMQANHAIRQKINIKDSPDNYNFNPPETLSKKLSTFTDADTPISQMIKRFNPDLLNKMKDVRSAELWQVGHPAMFRSRMLKMWLGATIGGVGGTMMGGPVTGLISGAAPILATMPATWRRVIHMEQALGNIKQQLTTARPNVGVQSPKVSAPTPKE